MRASAVLTLHLADSSARRSLSAVLAPDNEGFPGGLRFSMTEQGSSLSVSVQSDSIQSVVSGVLAFVRDIVLFQEVWLLSRTKRA